MSSSKLSILSGKIIEAGWLAAVVVVPLFFNPYSSTVTHTDKLIFLRSIVLIMGAAWVAQSIERRDVPRSRSAILRAPLALAIILLLVVELISSILSIFPRASIFGAYRRPDGLEAFFTYLVLFAMIAQELRTRQQLNRLLMAIVLGSFPVALYAIIQRFGLDPLNWSGEDFGGRVGSTLGNPIFMAGYLIMAFTLTLAKIFQSLNSLMIENKRESHAGDIFVAILYGAMALAQALAIFYSESRGPWLSELVGLLFFLLLLVILAHKYWLKRVILGLGIFGIAALILFNLQSSPLGGLRDLPGLGRLGRLADSTASFRLQTWDNVARLVTPHAALQFPDGAVDALNLLRPVLGYGADTLSVIYPQLAAPDPITQARATDHSHNETWDVLATGGIAGLIAYQALFLAIFFHSLSYLDLLPTRRARNVFIGLWFGLAFAGGGAAIGLGMIQYVGLAIPAGNMASLAVYLAWIALQSKNRVAMRNEYRDDQILMAALLAGLVAHFVETQFGINLVATRTLFWVFAALVWVVGSGVLKETAVARSVSACPRSWLSEASSYPFMIALVLSTLIFGFVAPGEKDAWLVLWQALTYNPLLQINSYAVLAIILATFGFGVSLASVEFCRAGELKDGNVFRQAGRIAGMTTICVLLFAFIHSAMVSALGAMPGTPMNPRDALAIGDQLMWITNGYVLCLFALILLCALALTWESGPAAHVWFSNRWTQIALAPTAMLTFFLANNLNFDLARADVAYRLGQAMDSRSDWGASIALYKRAIALSPSNDAYYMTLAHAFSEEANSLEVGSTARFGNQTTLKDILEWNASAPLSRNDWLYATLLTLLRARDLNPLYVNHTLNLARFYIPEAPINSPAKERLANLAEKYFTQAARLESNNARMWNEWADFELAYRNDPDAALRRLGDSVARDPKSVETYIALGEAYRAKQDYESAANAYRRALLLDPARSEAASKLAFVYYQQGKHAESIGEYQNFISLAPHSPNLWEAHKNLALLYSLENNVALAVREAEIAARLAPEEYQEQINQLIARLQAQTVAD